MASMLIGYNFIVLVWENIISNKTLDDWRIVAPQNEIFK